MSVAPPLRIVVTVAVVAVLVALAIIAWLWGPSPPGPRAATAAGEAAVVRVVDGDTLVVALNDGREETVRLIGIDTPESVAPDRPVECYGAEASERLASLLPAGTTVRLTRDVEPRDVYDRLLAYVERVPDGLFVNAAQVAAGYAEAKHYPPNTAYRDRFDRAELAARQARLGLWSACGSADVALSAPQRPP